MGNITFSLIKPNAIRNGHIGEIIQRVTSAGFRITALKMTLLSRKGAARFYGHLKDKPFFDELLDFMISGPVVVMIVRKKNAVEEYRKLIGSTDPKKADEGTIRKEFGEDIQMNAVHGSDSDENADKESYFFFPERERFCFEMEGSTCI